MGAMLSHAAARGARAPRERNDHAQIGASGMSTTFGVSPPVSVTSVAAPATGASAIRPTATKSYSAGSPIGVKTGASPAAYGATIGASTGSDIAKAPSPSATVANATSTRL